MLLLSTAVLLIAMDQVSKALVVSRLGEGQSIAIWRLRLRRLTNRRFAAGLPFANIVLVGLCLLEVVLIGTLVTYGPLPHRLMVALALGVALGGAVSNTIDRLRVGGVVDFIDVGFWPVFNIADASISVGVAASLMLVLA